MAFWGTPGNFNRPTIHMEDKPKHTHNISASHQSLPFQLSKDCAFCSNVAVVKCNKCELILCCVCMLNRHSLGSLIKHHMELIVPEKSGIVDENTCEKCRQRSTVVYCSECEIRFCQLCLNLFHSKGAATRHSYDGFFQSIRRNSSDPITVRRQSSFSVVEIAKVKLHSTDVLEFKLDSFTVGTFEDSSSTIITSKSRGQLVLVFDCPKRVFMVSVQNDEDGFQCLQVRPFRSVAGVSPNIDHPTRFLVRFAHLFHPMEFETKNLEDTDSMVSLFSGIRQKELISVQIMTENDSFFEGIGFKKGKLQWALRWIVIKRNFLLVFRNTDSLVPINTISIVQIPFKKIGHTQFELTGHNRKFVFKMEDEFLRDTVIEILEMASTEQTSGESFASKLLPAQNLSNENTPWTPGVSDHPNSQQFIIQKNRNRILSRSDAFNLMEEKTSMNPAFFHQLERREVAKNFCDILSRRIAPKSSNHPALIRSKTVFGFIENQSLYADPPSVDSSYQLSPLPIRVFWLLKRISLSMETGAYITRAMFVPRAFWYHSSIKIHAYSVKKDNFKFLLAALQSIRSANPDDDLAFEKDLSLFYEQCEIIQNNLSQHLSYVEPSKKFSTSQNQGFFTSLKDFGASVVKAAGRVASTQSRVRDNSDYVQRCIQCFNESQIFSDWLVLFQDHEAQYRGVWEFLLKIRQFFYEVICPVALNDVKLVVTSYTKHCTRQLVE